MGITNYPATVISAVDCAALSWPINKRPDLSARISTFGLGVHKTIGKRLDEVHERMMDVFAEHVEKRIARVVLSLLH